MELKTSRRIESPSSSIFSLIYKLKELRQELLDKLDEKFKKVDNKVEELQSVVDEIKQLEKGDDGKDADEQAVADYVISEIKDWVHGEVIPQIKQPKDGNDGVSPDPEEIAKNVLSRIPKVNEQGIVNKVLSKVPKQDLKILQQRFEVDPEVLIDKLLKSPKLKLKIGNVDGLDATLKLLDRRYIHGGGDTVSAGTGISIANVNGTKQISSSASTFYSDTVSGTIDGVNTVFTVANNISTALSLYLANSIYQPGVDFTVTGLKEITMTVAPDSSLSGQPFWLLHN